MKKSKNKQNEKSKKKTINKKKIEKSMRKLIPVPKMYNTPGKLYMAGKPIDRPSFFT